MSSEAEKEELRKIIMLISDLRAKDEERYEAHVNFMNETIKMIRAIENQMNKHWEAVLENLKDLNEDIVSSLETLLTGINPKGLKETSQSLKEIMNTMNKSVQSMNLEKVLNELKVLQSGTYSFQPSGRRQAQPEPITAGTGLESPRLKSPVGASQPGLKPPGGAAATGTEEESEWVDPHDKAKKEKEEEEPHLLKPSDFFGL